jgi:hypothetical protein
LAAGSGRTNLRGDANLLAEKGRARRIVEAACRATGQLRREYAHSLLRPILEITGGLALRTFPLFKGRWAVLRQCRAF